MSTHSHPNLSYLSNLLHSRQPDRQAAERETRNTRYEIETLHTLPPAVYRSTKNKNKQEQEQITSTVHSFVRSFDSTRLNRSPILARSDQVRSGQVPLRYVCKYVLSPCITVNGTNKNWKHREHKREWKENVCYSILVELQTWNLCRDTLYKVCIYGHVWIRIDTHGHVWIRGIQRD